MHEMEDPRRYIRAMNLIRARIQDGTAKPDELIPVNTLSGQTGYSRHTLSKALRLLEQEGLVARIPGLGYCVQPHDDQTVRIHQEGG
jgi:DNA-binding GntR family transcriptional regulator